MKTADIRYRLPQGLYDRLEKVATDKGIAMRDVLIRILDDSLPLINTPLIAAPKPKPAKPKSDGLPPGARVISREVDHLVIPDYPAPRRPDVLQDPELAATLELLND